MADEEAVEMVTRRPRAAVMVAAAVVVVAVAIVIGLAVWRSASSDSPAVPPLTAAEKEAGAIRVTYPDRTLPDEPEVGIVGGQRVALFFDHVTEADGRVSVTLGVVTAAGDPPGIRDEVTLAEGQTRVVGGVAITLLDAFATGDPEHDAADVSLTTSHG